MTVRTIRDRILVQPADAETKTAGGLFIPDNATDGPVKGTVISAGSGRVTEDGTIVPLEVFVGNTVMYVKGAGHAVKVNDVDHIVLTEDQIIAIVE
jgi:chaperonin GroES|tara:strand:- start:50 stop:337 length:288 start_codon:yes stop_codon:yes gene_type:complete